MVAEKEQCFPGVIERRRDGIYHVGHTGTKRAPCLEHRSPLDRAPLCEMCQRVVTSWPNQPCELTRFRPGCVQYLLVSERIGKNDSPTMPVEAVINKRAIRLRPFGPRERR